MNELDPQKPSMSVFAFIGMAVLWTVLAPGIGLGAVMLGMRLGGSRVVAIGSVVLGLGVIGGLAYSSTRLGSAGVRRGSAAGTFCGIGLGLLLFGLCFYSLSRIEL